MAKDHATNAIEHNKRRIYSWLVEYFSIVQTQSKPETIWSFEARNKPTEGSINVVQLHAKPERIIIQSGIGIAESNQNALGKMPSDDRVLFLCDLQLMLLKMGVEYIGATYPTDSVYIFDFLYPDPLTRNQFMQSVFKVHKAVWAVLIMLEKNLSKREPSDPFAEASILIH